MSNVKTFQHTTLKTFTQIYLKSLLMKVQLLKGVENIVAKEEIAHYEQFLLLPHCFQKSSAANASTRGEG